MGLVHEGLEKGVVAEAGVDMVIVRAGIAVIALIGLVVQQERRIPDGRRAQVRHIVQVVDDALEVAAVAGHGILTVHSVRGGRNGPRMAGAVDVFPALPLLIVVHEGRGKAVRHDQVDHIGRGIALALPAAFLALPHLVGILELLLPTGEDQIRLPGGEHVQVHE